MPLKRWSISFSSSSTSSSSSPSSSSSSSSNNRKLTRAKQIRYLRDCDIQHLNFSHPLHCHHVDDSFRTSPSPFPSPHPLPLPETLPLSSSVDVNLKSESKPKSKPKRAGYAARFRLPSPTTVCGEKKTTFHIEPPHVSLGCTIIEMMTGKPPWNEFEGAAAMFKVLKESPPIPETLSSERKDFLRCCFQRDPADRPPASKLLDHPFLRTSQQLDFSSSRIRPDQDLMNQMGSRLDDLSSKDKVAHSPRDRYDHKLEKIPKSPRRTAYGSSHISKRGQVYHLETLDSMVKCRQSQQSILEPARSPSPLH